MGDEKVHRLTGFEHLFNQFAAEATLSIFLAFSLHSGFLSEGVVAYNITVVTRWNIGF